MKDVPIGNYIVGEKRPLTIISGPCVIESEEHTLFMAKALKEILGAFQVQFIFKASYDKANRSSIHSFRGPGIDKGLSILKKVKEQVGVPVISDIHSPEEVSKAKEVLDVLQIPAFLCRQTDLIVACAETGLPIHIKKGQFLAPHDMKNVVDKIRSCNNDKIILVDRGTCFGYNNLVSDMRAIPIMQRFGFPVSFDASHSVQLPGAGNGVTVGEQEFIPVLARSAVAAGCQVLFIETHDRPEEAKSDRGSVLSLNEMKRLLEQLVPIYQIVHGLNTSL